MTLLGPLAPTTAEMTLDIVRPRSADHLCEVPSGSRRNVLLAALAALLYVVVVGMVTSYSAPACVDMRRPGSRFSDITDQQITWIASLPALAGVLGNAVSGYLSHRFGRKAVLMYVSAPYASGWLTIAYAPDLGLVYAGRLISGFCAGICSVAVPAYVVEISPVDIRGFLTAGFQVAFALGVFLTMALGIFLRWSWLAVSGAALVVSGACLLCLMPESPPWLIRASRKDEAFRGLRFLRGNYGQAVKEFQEILDHQAEEPGKDLRLKQELMDPRLYKPLLIAVLLMFFQQFSGIKALMSYAVELFQNSESFLDPSLAATAVALIQVLATGTSSLLMDRAGRRALYVTSGVCATLSLTAAGAYSYLSQNGQVAELWRWVPLASFATYIGAFSLGFGPVPFVVTPEMVPTRSRSFLLAVASVSSSFFSFVVTKTFDDLRGAVGLFAVYWMFAAFAFIGFLFYWCFVPETKGRTIRDIHRSFSRPENGDGSRNFA